MGKKIEGWHLVMCAHFCLFKFSLNLWFWGQNTITIGNMRWKMRRITAKIRNYDYFADITIGISFEGHEAVLPWQIIHTNYYLFNKHSGFNVQDDEHIHRQKIEYVCGVKVKALTKNIHSQIDCNGIAVDILHYPLPRWNVNTRLNNLTKMNTAPYIKYPKVLFRRTRHTYYCMTLVYKFTWFHTMALGYVYVYCNYINTLKNKYYN